MSGSIFKRLFVPIIIPFVLIVIGLAAFFPKTADVLAIMSIVFFVFPLMTGSMTLVVYAIDAYLIAHHRGADVFIRDFLLGGLPFGLFISWYALKE